MRSYVEEAYDTDLENFVQNPFIIKYQKKDTWTKKERVLYDACLVIDLVEPEIGKRNEVIEEQLAFLVSNDFQKKLEKVISNHFLLDQLDWLGLIGSVVDNAFTRCRNNLSDYHDKVMLSLDSKYESLNQYDFNRFSVYG